MTNPAAARTGILELHARYTDAVWRQDADTFADCFAPDGEWRISGMVLRGRDEIRDTIAKILSRFDAVLISFRTPILEIGDGFACGRTSIDEKCAWKNSDRNISVGRYYEHFILDGDHWRFSWRLFQMLYRGDPDLSGTFFDPPDFGPPPGMPPRDAIPEDTASTRWGLKP